METQKYRHMISVVVPVYNAQEYLAVMIESLLNQSYAKWELILVENGQETEVLKFVQCMKRRIEEFALCRKEKKGHLRLEIVD